jgi:hypothetical protein
MKRAVLLFIGAVLAAVLQMAWGFTFWMATPIPLEHMVKTLPAEQEGQIVKALGDADVESGHYFYPFPDKEAMSGKNEEAMKAFQKKHAAGPLVEIVYRKDGLDPRAEGLTYVYGFGHCVGTALLAGFLLLLASPALRSYARRVLFVALLGVFAAITITLANPIWYHHPWKFSLISAGFEVVAWLLSAVVLGAFVRPPKLAAVGHAPHLTPQAFHPSDRVRV